MKHRQLGEQGELHNSHCEADNVHTALRVHSSNFALCQTSPWLRQHHTLSRRDAVILRRLRIGHTRVTHKYLLSGDSQPLCDKCQCSLTIKHILLECCSLKDVREKYFTCNNPGFYQRSRLLSSCLVIILMFPFYISYWSFAFINSLLTSSICYSI